MNMGNDTNPEQGRAAEVRASRPLEPVASVLARFNVEEQERLHRILEEPLGFLNHASFGRARTAKKLFGDDVEAEELTQPWKNSAEACGLTDHSTVQVATLTTAQEQRLFLRMNYARYRMSLLLDKYRNRRLPARAAREILFWHTQMMNARCSIVQANVPLVLAMSKRTHCGNFDYAELISEGNMALLRSVDKFDCSRGFKFSTYACRAILKSFSRVAMRSSRYRNRFPAEFEPALEKSDHQDRQRERLESDCVDELKVMLHKNTAELSDVETRVILARFAIGADPADSPKTLEQVGMMIGVTKERVRQIQNRALAKLREKLQQDFLAA